MKCLSFVLAGKKSTPGIKSVLPAVVVAILLILSIMFSAIASTIIPVIPAFLVLAVYVVILIVKRNEKKVSYNSYMQLSDNYKREMTDQIKSYLENHGTDFGVLTDVGVWDRDFFIRWSDVRSVRFTPRKYTAMDVLIDGLPTPGYCIIGGIVDLNGKKHKVVHSMEIRPTRDMSREIDRFIEFALRHNPRVSISNEYRFASE